MMPFRRGYFGKGFLFYKLFIMENEIWKDVPNYEGLYQVSNLGNVKSLGNDKTRKERILNPSINSRGYYQVSLSNKNIKTTKRVHILVAEAFLNHKACGMVLVIDHINDNPLDNRLENLQIVTTRFNTKKTQGKYSSHFKGVSWDIPAQKWVSNIEINRKKINLGRFNCELAAHQAYQNKLKEISC